MQSFLTFDFTSGSGYISMAMDIVHWRNEVNNFYLLHPQLFHPSTVELKKIIEKRRRMSFLKFALHSLLMFWIQCHCFHISVQYAAICKDAPFHVQHE